MARSYSPNSIRIWIRLDPDVLSLFPDPTPDTTSRLVVKAPQAPVVSGSFCDLAFDDLDSFESTGPVLSRVSTWICLCVSWLYWSFGFGEEAPIHS